MIYRTLISPINVQVEITWSCHNICRHCYNFYRHDDTPRLTMSDRQIDYLSSEFTRLKPFRGVITGGEPLIVPKRALRLARGMHDAGMAISLNSTLRFLTQSVADELWEIDPRTTILTSLISSNPKSHDFVTQKQGSWEETVAGIKIAVARGFRVSVNMVLTDWNIDNVQSTGDFVASLGVAQFGATRACAPTPLAADFHKHIITVEQLRESLDVMHRLHEKHGYSVDVFEHYPLCVIGDLNKYNFFARRKCTAGITSCSIGANGNIRPCGHAPLSYDNVFEVGLEKAWTSLKEWRERKYISKGCSDCKFFNYCTGGCPVEAMNSKAGKDPHVTSQDDIVSMPTSEPPYLPSASENFEYAPYTILRKEHFGGIVGSGKGGVVLVDSDTYFVLSELKKLTSFDVEHLTKQFSIQRDQAEKLLGRLFSQGLILKKGGICEHSDRS